jgi:peptide-methionine (S)-S-oxide reductase
MQDVSYDELILGGGCFWCLDPIFHRLKGLALAESGYCGGHVLNPTYQQVCEGTTGHAEVLRLRFDPQVLSLDTVLSVFFTFHDPTTLNRQGHDIGTQYRSVIFYRDEAEKTRIKEIMNRLEATGIWPNQWVTRLEPMAPFYPAEDYHQRYFETHGHTGYCAGVIAPKVAKLRAQYAALLVPDA